MVSDLWITEWRAMLTDGAYFDLDEWGQRMGIEKQQPCIYADESDELLRKVSIVSGAWRLQSGHCLVARVDETSPVLTRS